MVLAAGQILLDSTGRRILDSSGKQILSNGTDDSTCCCAPCDMPCFEVTLHGVTACCQQKSVAGDAWYQKIDDISTLLEVPIILFGTSLDVAYYGLATGKTYWIADGPCNVVRNIMSNPLAGFGIHLVGGVWQFNAAFVSVNYFHSNMTALESMTVSNDMPACNLLQLGTGGTATLRKICVVPLLGLSGGPYQTSKTASIAVSFSNAGGSQVVNVHPDRASDEWFVGLVQGTIPGSTSVVVNSPFELITFSVTSGIGDGNFTIVVAANTTGLSRTNVICVNSNRSITVTQAA